MASSAEAHGRPVHHRLNRFGNRRLNSVLYGMAIVRLRVHPETRAYIARKRAEGKSTKEAIRCLKRHLARRLFKLLEASSRPPAVTPATAPAT